MRTFQAIVFWLVLFGLVIFGIKSCQETAWYQASEKADEQARVAANTPHVIREADGCKVYEFNVDHTYHFFTRCPVYTTTERHYNESCGKNKTCERVEEIQTINSKAVQ